MCTLPAGISRLAATSISAEVTALKQTERRSPCVFAVSALSHLPLVFGLWLTDYLFPSAGKYIVIHATVPTSTSPTFSDYSLVEMKLDDRAVVSLSARALPGPIWDHPIYESSGLPETDHTLTLTWVDKPNTTKFCLDRVSISSNIGSAYIPELLTPASTLVSEELESRDFVEYSPDSAYFQSLRPRAVLII